MGNLATIGEDVKSVEVKPMEDLIKRAAKELAKSLPSHMGPARIMQIYLTCLRLNPQLTKCTPASLIGALFVSAQLGLEPVAGNAYILPFNNSKNINGKWVKVLEAQFLIGYKGLVTLFYRHEKAVQINWGVVHEKDDFSYQYGTEQFLKHIPAKEGGKVIGYYVVAVLQNGGKSFMYMTKDACIAHGQKHSKTFVTEEYDKKQGKRVKCEPHFLAQSPWVTSEELMCLKTTLIQLGKLLPLSIELQRAISADETSREYREGIDNALDLPDQTNWDETPAIEESIVEEAKGQNPAEEPKKETAGVEPATLPQCQKIHIVLGELIKANVITEADFYAQINKRFNINIDSTKSLTKTQASDVIEELQQQADKIAQEGKKEATEVKVKHICYDCYDHKKEAVELTEAEAGYSKEHFGRKLCRTCQEKARKSKE